MPLYFAYGSNMDLAQMAARCPASRPVGLARLAGHRFAIMREGYATVARDPRRQVWGMLWSLAPADVPALDRYEGVSGGLYIKAVQAVRTQDGARRALVYLGSNAGPGAPRPDYLEGVLAAARSAGLPAAYLREIEAAGQVAMPGRRVPGASRPAVTPTRVSPRDPVSPITPAGWVWTP